MEWNGSAYRDQMQAEENGDLGDSSSGDGSTAGRMDRLNSFDSSESTARSINDANRTPRKALNGTYSFSLTGYSFVRNLGVGNHIRSGTFVVGGHEWAILFFPNDKSDEDQSKYVSLFVALLSDSYDVEARLQMTLLDRSGKGKHLTQSQFEGHASPPYVLKAQGSMWGLKRFLRQDVFEQSDYLKDDTIVLTGKVGVLPSSVKPARLPITPNSPNSPSPLDRDGKSGEDESRDSKGDGLRPESTFTKSRIEGLPRRRFEKLQLLEDQLLRYYQDVKKATYQSPISVQERQKPVSVQMPQSK